VPAPNTRAGPRANAAARADRAQKNLSETMINTPYKP
jgi:hypothetical protein